MLARPERVLAVVRVERDDLRDRARFPDLEHEERGEGHGSLVLERQGSLTRVRGGGEPPAIPAMIGMFAASELFRLVKTRYLVEDSAARKVSARIIFAGFLKAFRYPWILLRGSLIGVFVGSVPGVGSSVANLLSYIATKKSDPDPDSFGKGNPAGVIASEAANSTSEAGSMATLLALGIPGGGATAVMLAAFAMHNITGGPQFIREKTDIVYAIIFANFGQAFLLIALGLMFIPILANVVKVPMTYLVGQSADDLPGTVCVINGRIRCLRFDRRPVRADNCLSLLSDRVAV